MLDPGNVEAAVGTAQVDMAMGAAFMTEVGSTHFDAAETELIRVLSFVPNHAKAHMFFWSSRGTSRTFF